jgi:hypothetical protein
MEMLYASFMANSGLQAHIVRTMLAKHAKDPEPLIKAMEMEMPREPSGETFVGIMTKPVKPDRPEWAPAARRFGGETTPGFAHRPSEEENADNDRENIPANEARKTPEKAAAHDSEKTQTLSCVGFRISDHAIQHDTSQQSDDCMQRERVGDIGSDAEGIDRSSFAGSDLGAELLADQRDQRKLDAATGQASNEIRATLHSDPASASTAATGLPDIAPARHTGQQAAPATARASRAAVMAGKSFARCSSLPRAATEGNALQRDRQYYRTQDDTAASSAIRTAWAGAQTESGNAARQTGVSAEPLPTTPEFQGDPQAAPPPFQTAHGKGATQRPGVLAAPLTALKPPRFQGDCNAAAPPHGEGAIRSRRATIPLTARRKVIESGKRRKRPVVRYSAVPWHGVAAMRNVPQHWGKAVANRCAAGCRRSISDCNATDRGRHVYDPCTNRVRIVVGCVRIVVGA